jgi:hypothetical protein
MNGSVKSGLILALTLCGCGTAYAHAHLLQSAPGAGVVATAAPGVLRLDFSEGVQPGFTGVTLRGPGGAIVSTGHARLAANDEELLVPLPRALTRGQCTVEWHALSDDGHMTGGLKGSTSAIDCLVLGMAVERFAVYSFLALIFGVGAFTTVVPCLIHDDLDTPILTLLSENDARNFRVPPQPDSKWIRVWEVAACWCMDRLMEASPVRLAYRRTCAEAGMPSPAIWVSALHPIIASVF